jgi:hypothetical protein
MSAAPTPIVEARFEVQPHPDPLVQSLIQEIERLRAELQQEREKAMKESGTHPR